MISLISSFQKFQSKTILIEIIDTKSLEFYKKIGLKGVFFDSIEANLKKKKDKETFMTFYGDFFTAEKLIVLFLDKNNLMDERSDGIKKIPNNTLYIPYIDYKEALEVYTLTTYTYDAFITKKEAKIYEFYTPEKERKILENTLPLLHSITRARDLINLPPSDTRPDLFVEHIKNHLWKHFSLRVIDADELKKLGCNLLLAVGSGSDFPPYMVILERIVDKKLDTYALIGKGVTFDAGGLQIKPDTGMLDMKCDMSGAAGMLGVAEYLDTLDTLPCNIIVGLGITENVINGKAFKPLDIYRAYNNKTVEIHHTDAEGRLVLADVMSYIEDVYHPEHMITMATLTGACIYALGYDIAGIMGDDDEVIESLIHSDSPYERLWRLPLTEKIKKSLKGEISDLKSITKSEKAGSSLGGAFLSYFQGKSRLTHIDIAGPAYRETSWGYMPKGGTGWGVKILSEFLLSQKKKSKS